MNGPTSNDPRAAVARDRILDALLDVVCIERGERDDARQLLTPFVDAFVDAFVENFVREFENGRVARAKEPNR